MDYDVILGFITEDQKPQFFVDGKKTKGTVRWFDRSLGYGFITEDGHKDDIFFHYSSIQVPGSRNLSKGQRVVFDRFFYMEKWVALNVIPVKAKNPPSNSKKEHPE